VFVTDIHFHLYSGFCNVLCWGRLLLSSIILD
jgi:hypothetical protein